jgi:tellurite resistance protein
MPAWVGQVFAAVAVLAFVILLIAYAIKAVTGFDNVKREFEHPIAGNLFGTLFISFLLLPLLLAESHRDIARVLWIVGAIAMTVFAWTIVSRWIGVAQKPEHATPAWIVPAVGMIDIPLALPALGWSDSLHGVMAFSTAVGLFFALPLLTLIFARLMFAAPLPDGMKPSLLILVAPFSVGFSAYVATAGHIDGFAEALYMLMLFMLAVVMGRLRDLGRCCPFRVSWWAVSFPLAASASTALRYAAHVQNEIATLIAIALLVVATVVIVALLLRTLVGIAKGELRALST